MEVSTSAGREERSRELEAMQTDSVRRLYLDLLKKALSHRLYHRPSDAPPTFFELAQAEAALERARQRYSGPSPSLGGRLQSGVADQMLACSPERIVGWMRNHPLEAFTLTNEAGIDNVENCVLSVLERGVPGDLMECGVWKGGLTILMRGLLKACGVVGRKVWVADSFQGLPAPDPVLSPVDAISHEFLTLVDRLAVSEEDVRDNFARFDLLDHQVQFLPGWFSESLPAAPIQSLAVLRLDADYYDSTFPILEHLYPKVSVGGFVIVDDYRILNFGAGLAVDEYRMQHGIEDPMIVINDQAAYWQKSSA
jgi:O-methyltransferase